MGKRGPRPSAEQSIDVERLKELAFAGCSGNDMAALLGVPHATMDKVLHREPLRSVVLAERARRRLELSELQWATATSGGQGAAALQIFLGKNELGQSDRQRTEISGSDGKPIEMKHDGIAVRTPDELGEILAGLESVGALTLPNGSSEALGDSEPTKH